MGGNAVSGVRRFEAKEYRTLVDQLIPELMNDVLGTAYIEEIPYYKNKQNFGDADLVVRGDTLNPNWKSYIITAFMLKKDQWYSNGDVFSFNYHELQVDLIVAQPRYYRSTINYFSWNDLGNIAGRLAKRVSIKSGHKGLSIVLRDNEDYSRTIAEVELSQNIYDLFDILGLDGEKFAEGFDELEDMFEWVATSKYFDPEIFALENRNATDRIRDKKRKTYQAFLKWIETTKPKANHSFLSKSERGGYNLREPYYSDVILKKFPDVKEVIDRHIAKHELDKKFKSVYNGDVVGELTGLSGKELGGFMSYLRPMLYESFKVGMIKDPSIVADFIKLNFKEYKNVTPN